MGEITPVFYSRDAYSIENITLCDAYGKVEKIKFFDTLDGVSELGCGAVYLPYSVNFHSVGGVFHTEYILNGDTLVPPDAPLCPGYDFSAWYIDEGCENIYDFSQRD